MEAEILMLLGDRLFSNHHKDYKRALEYYQAAGKLMPNSATCFTKLGLVYEYLKKCLKINPKYVTGMISMGNLLFESGHANNACKYFQQALNHNPKEIQALIGIANALYDLGEAQEAIEYYQRVIEIDEEIADVYYNLANAQYLLNNIHEAVNNY